MVGAMRLASLVVLAGLTSAAHAAPPGLTPPTPEPVPQAEPLPADYTASYRGQTLGADAAAVGLVLLAAAGVGGQSHQSNTTSLLELAAATYVLGGPMIHLLHDRPGRAAASLALRVAAPLVFAMVGAAIGRSDPGCTGGYCDVGPGESDGAALGGLLGVITASVIDAAVFARADPLPASSHLTATAVRGGGMTFGIAGSF